MKDNKILLVTGASSDLGIEIIKLVNQNYGKILAHYNHENKRLLQLKDELGEHLELIQADLSDMYSVEQMIDKIWDMKVYPDHIIHLASPKFRIQKFLKESVDEFHENYAVSVESIIAILKAFMPAMVRQHYGKVVFALSSNVNGTPAKFQSVYTVNKYALLGLTKSLAVEYADKGICVNAVSPSMMDTKFLSEIPDLIVQQTANISPLKRNLNVQEVAPTFAYLLCSAADFVTGENIAVTGGAL